MTISPPIAKPTRTRRSRFGPPAKPPNLQITPFDIGSLADHYKYRFLTSHQAASLHPERSAKKSIERIGQLQAAGYLDRPRNQTEYYRPGGGSSANIHAISNAGMRILAQAANRDPGRLNWSYKNNQATRPFIQHTVAVADVGIAFELACRQTPGVVLQELPELLAQMPKATQEADNPLKIRATVTYNGERSDQAVVPDIALALRFADGSRRALLIEVDRGTMPVRRKSLKGTSLIKKCLVYDAARRAGIIQKQLGWKSCRILFVTSDNPDRAANLAHEITDLAQLKSSPLFLIADTSALTGEHILTFPWQAPSGSTHRLLP